ncbi:MAG TPA: hypothetical protein VF623_09530 [Segetibacter sp.]|jgi:hypothetical protein
MKIATIIFLILIATTGHAQDIPSGFYKNGTMFQGGGQTTAYILLDSKELGDSIATHEVTLKRSLYTQPQTDLIVKIYNVLFNKKYLAVFSVMPSLLSNEPLWKKVNVDTLKIKPIRLPQLHELMLSRFKSYPQVSKGVLDKLKYWNYSLIIKRKDGYYMNKTDCITEFFTLADKVSKPTAHTISLNTPMLSTAEYESAFRRKEGTYSSNYRYSKNFSFNDELKRNPMLHLSYKISAQGKTRYKFWLLDNWSADYHNADRGMDRFLFDPEIGVVGASYDFFLPDVIALTSKNINSKAATYSANKEQSYIITKYYTEYDPILYDYLNENVLNYISIIKL